MAFKEQTHTSRTHHPTNHPQKTVMTDPNPRTGHNRGRHRDTRAARPHRGEGEAPLLPAALRSL